MGDNNTDAQKNQLETQILELLNESGSINESGLMLYDKDGEGKGADQPRTGSAVRALLDWVLYKKGNVKPMDSDLFKRFLEDEMNVNLHGTTSKWQKLTRKK